MELGHHGDECSFDAIIKKYELDKKDPSLLELAKIVRGADTPNRSLTPQSSGLLVTSSFLSYDPVEMRSASNNFHSFRL